MTQPKSNKVNVNACWQVINGARHIMRDIASGKIIPDDIKQLLIEQISILRMELEA